jgi:hypothetical protein
MTCIATMMAASCGNMFVFCCSKSEMSLRATLDKTVKDIINEFLRPDHYKLIARSI